MRTPFRRIILDTLSPRIDLGNGYSLAWVVNEDGERWPLLYNEDQGPRGNLSFEQAPHENIGPIPKEIRRKFGMTCPHIATTTGKRCTNVVHWFGEACAHHRDKEKEVAA